MATFQQNIQKIRGDAIYGSETREAIAEAIAQTGEMVINFIEMCNEAYEQFAGAVFSVVLSPIGASGDDMKLTITKEER